MVWVELKLTPQALVARNKVRRLIALAKLTELLRRTHSHRKRTANAHRKLPRGPSRRNDGRQQSV